MGYFRAFSEKTFFTSHGRGGGGGGRRGCEGGCGQGWGWRGWGGSYWPLEEGVHSTGFPAIGLAGITRGLPECMGALGDTGRDWDSLQVVERQRKMYFLPASLRHPHCAGTHNSG